MKHMATTTAMFKDYMITLAVTSFCDYQSLSFITTSEQRYQHPMIASY